MSCEHITIPVGVSDTYSFIHPPKRIVSMIRIKTSRFMNEMDGVLPSFGATYHLDIVNKFERVRSFSIDWCDEDELIRMYDYLSDNRNILLAFFHFKEDVSKFLESIMREKWFIIIHINLEHSVSHMIVITDDEECSTKEYPGYTMFQKLTGTFIQVFNHSMKFSAKENFYQRDFKESSVALHELMSNLKSHGNVTSVPSAL